MSKSLIGLARSQGEKETSCVNIALFGIPFKFLDKIYSLTGLCERVTKTSKATSRRLRCSKLVWVLLMMGRAMPAGFEDRLRAWLALFIPQTEFLPLQNLLCAHQTDTYSCGIIAVNTLKHHLYGNELWASSRRETLRIQEFLDIMEFSESWNARVSAFWLLYMPMSFTH
jgi:hypothetical protein